MNFAQTFLVNSLLSSDTFYIANFLFVHFNSVSSSISTQSSSAHVEERDQRAHSQTRKHWGRDCFIYSYRAIMFSCHHVRHAQEIKTPRLYLQKNPVWYFEVITFFFKIRLRFRNTWFVVLPRYTLETGAEVRPVLFV